MLHPALDINENFVIITTVNVYYLFSKANYSFKDYSHACTCGDISKKEQVS